MHNCFSFLPAAGAAALDCILGLTKLPAPLTEPLKIDRIYFYTAIVISHPQGGTAIVGDYFPSACLVTVSGPMRISATPFH